MDSIKIEHNVPMPDSRPRTGKYPVDSIDVGDSFIVPRRDATRVRSVVMYISNKSGRKFITRTIDEDTVRVWRTD